jgi:hypothetical protein
MKAKIRQATAIKTLVVPRHLRFLKGKYGGFYAALLTYSLQTFVFTCTFFVISNYSMGLYSSAWLLLLTAFNARSIYHYWQGKLDYVLTLQTIQGMINGD